MSEESREALRKELGGKTITAPAAVIVPPVKVEQPELATQQHSDRCAKIRGGECNCAANLETLAELTPLERSVQKHVEWVDVPSRVENGKVIPASKRPVEHTIELWRVDDGKDHTRTIPHPSGSPKAPPFPITERLPPRWICTKCGWGGRGSNVRHRCDKTASSLATRQKSISEMLTREQRFSGAYRLVMWRDQDQKYHLAEELVEAGKVVKTVELYADEGYDVFEGILLNETVDKFS